MQANAIGDDRRLVRTSAPGIYKRGGAYVVVWKHNGKQHKSSHRTLSEAKRTKAQRASGDTLPVSRRRFDEYAREWVESTEGRTRVGLSDHTRASYRDALERKAIPFFGSRRLGEITPPTVRDFTRALAGEGLSAATVRRYYAPVRALLATAVEDGLILTNPAREVRVIVRGVRRQRPQVFTPTEYRALLAEVPEHWRPLVRFIARTGTRISEALAATWGDLGQSDGKPVLKVRDSKTDAGVRDVPLTPDLLRDLIQRRAEASYRADADLIFPNATGTPTDAHNFRRRVFNPAVKRAGLPAGLTPHKLRHTYASVRLEHGDNDVQLAQDIGHTDPGFTRAVYGHSLGVSDVAYLDEVLGT